MFYTVYKITNRLNGKYYIGKHQTNNLDDGYMGSGKLIRRAIKVHGIENFTKEILHIFDNEVDMNSKEAEIVVVSEDTYNLCEGGKGGWSYVNRNGLTFTDNAKGKKFTETQLNSALKNFSMFNELEKFSKARREKSSKAFAGRFHSEDTKKRISTSMKRVDNSGSKNSQYGTCWITNGIEIKKVSKEDLDTWLNMGYSKSRKPQNAPI